MHAKKKESRVVAVIDIGSNSIKMSVARVSRTSWNVILQKKESLRLLDDGETKITKPKIKALVRILSGFMKAIDKYEPLVKIYATSAMRRAKNKKSVLRVLKNKYKINVKVISGTDEAIYVYHAVQSSFHVNRGSFGVIDIGGGSIELIQLESGKPKWMKSIPMGSVIVKNSYFEPEPKNEFDIIEKILQIQKQILKQIPKELKGYLIISGGSPSSIAKMFLDPKKFSQIHGKVIFMDELLALFKPLLEKNPSFWTNKHKINPSRVDLLLPCICTVIALMRIAGQDHFQVSRTGLRQGIIEEAFQKIQLKK
jgi:exopolyphosphatase/guanosine-5'-triphosphate,3'-diphosphate pyrophosphatase